MIKVLRVRQEVDEKLEILPHGFQVPSEDRP
jgi:hypothetical protein